MKFALITLVVASVCVLGTQAWFSSDNWNDLKVTWGMNLFSSHNFVSLPRTEKEAIQAGWKLDKDCSKINGRRYLLEGDSISYLLFTQNGIIAGIAASIPKGLPFNFPSKNIQPYFVDEGEYFTFNAYFTNPDTVCTTGTTREKTGDRLVIRGDSKEVSVPLKESSIKSFWTQGNCFWTMGNHWWANVNGVPLTADVDADDFFPMFLQYNSGNLNGFGWAFNANITSHRCEHPTPDVLPKFFKTVPKFMSDPTKAGVLSTLHIYLDSTPHLNFC